MQPALFRLGLVKGTEKSRFRSVTSLSQRYMGHIPNNHIWKCEMDCQLISLNVIGQIRDASFSRMDIRVRFLGRASVMF